MSQPRPSDVLTLSTGDTLTTNAQTALLCATSSHLDMLPQSTGDGVDAGDSLTPGSHPAVPYSPSKASSVLPSSAGNGPILSDVSTPSAQVRSKPATSALSSTPTVQGDDESSTPHTSFTPQTSSERSPPAQEASLDEKFAFAAAIAAAAILDWQYDGRAPDPAAGKATCEAVDRLLELMKAQVRAWDADSGATTAAAAEEGTETGVDVDTGVNANVKTKELDGENVHVGEGGQAESVPEPKIKKKDEGNNEKESATANQDPNTERPPNPNPKPESEQQATIAGTPNPEFLPAAAPSAENASKGKKRGTRRESATRVHISFESAMGCALELFRSWDMTGADSEAPVQAAMVHEAVVQAQAVDLEADEEYLRQFFDSSDTSVFVVFAVRL